MPPRLLVALLGCVLATACTGSSGGGAKKASVPLPKESAFLEGTCQAAAPDILAIGRQIDRLGDGPKVDQVVKAELQEAQKVLAELSLAAEPTYKPALDALVVTVGGVRIRADGNVYDPELATQLGRDYRGVLEVCLRAPSR